jgi:HSP20 family protein
LEAFQNRMARTFGGSYLAERAAWHPDVDVDEESDGWVVEVRLPGVAPEEVSVDVTERELVIRSRQSQEAASPEESGGGGDESVTTKSRRVREFQYRLSMPSDVDADAIDATMDHGLLTVRLPRSAQPKSRRIEIARPGDGNVVEGTVTDTPTAQEERA